MDFDGRWATIFVLIARQGPVAVMEIDEWLGITHPAVVQVINELEKQGLIVSAKSERDGRKRLLTLSETGHHPIQRGLSARFQTAEHCLNLPFFRS
ncbi:MarR family transcriptional regulator [Spirosoma radiotolerans]|uniref:HTH marR-type domain-containing protein n=1 Tax=Spirosoma radiotolerans TaxID=1379870 RepID=A0A0E3ZY11_9BACT|nr:MarR family transcriptional regulator [Spirosoma radiotolerans]AKD57423.1 hypothetical protein SD10_23565 [Spirosoma radiotolerans]